MMADDRRLVWSKHPGRERIYLVEVDNGERVRCPECHQSWPNFLRHPVQPVVNVDTGQIEYQNVLTDERMT